ncbi:hypothetical protein KAT24_01740 [Candidatus Pacearchaeota archaeon]|nr:hypothetical protein [Candidatus Pacearchaeota archaeon]
MKNIFKKISAVAASALMVGMTMGVAAAATTYPAPFVVGGTANVAIVYGTGTGVNPSDLVQAGFIQTNLASSVTSTGGTPSGDNVLLAESSDNLNINNTWSVFVGSVNDDDLPTLLADGTYIADDNDEFSYEQNIDLGTPELTHFRDSDYESLVGLSSRTPVVGFQISSSTYILNYTIDFLSDVTSDMDTNSRMDDIEGSELPLMGKNYYVSEFHNSTSATAAYFDKAILLDSANTGNVKEGETTTVAGKSVSIDWIDPDEVVFMVDGGLAPASGKLTKGQSYKLDDGSYIGVRDVKAKDVSGTIGSVSFSIGTGKLEINHGEDIKLNDDTISGVKGYLHKTSGTKLDKIIIQWKTDEECFISPASELTMPGFGAVKFSMNELVRSEEEKITLEKDSDTSIELTMPTKEGTISFNILYSNSTGGFIGIGKAADEKLATTNLNDLMFYEKRQGSDWHSYFVATYNTSKDGESYLLRAKVSQDTSAGRNETTIQKYDGSSWIDVCKEKKETDTCSIGDVSLTIGVINYTSGGDESVNITAGIPSDNKNVYFHTAVTPGGLYIYLPYDNNFTGVYSSPLSNDTEALGGVSFNASIGPEKENLTFKGHGSTDVALFMIGEDRDENIVGGTMFNLTLNDNTDHKLYVSEVDNAGTGGANGKEQGDTNIYETYIKDECAPRILHYTQPDEDWAEVYYPSGDSETYAEVFLTEEGSVLEGGESSLGDVLVMDTEVSSVSSKNLIVVGGSCINSAAATLIGGAKCTADFTTATGIGSGQFLIQSFGDAYTTGKIALLVAGYETADTVNAVTYLKTQTVDTTAGKKYKGTSSTSAELVVE